MDRDFLLDLFAAFGPVTLRRMFSGYGVSRDGINFALERFLPSLNRILVFKSGAF